MERQTVKSKGSSKTDSQITVEWHDAETASPQFRKLMAMLLRPAGDGYGKQKDKQHR